MKEAASEEVLQGVIVSAEEEFLLEWARETEKRNLPFTNDVLRQFVTISSSLLAGSVALLRDQVSPWLFLATVLCFLCSLGCAVAGIRPYSGSVYDNPTEIAEHKKKALGWKEDRVRWSSRFLFIGLIAAILGLTLRMF